MSSFSTIVDAVLPVFLLVFVGAIVRWRGLFPKESDRPTLGLVINVFIPCLIFDVILDNDALQDRSNLIIAPLFGFLSVVGGIALAYFAASGLRLDSKSRRSFSFAAGVCNYGYLPIPLCVALFDETTLGVLFVHNVGVELAIWTVVGPLLAGGGLKSGLKRAINAPMITLLLTVGLNLSGWGGFVPGAVRETASTLGACAIPIGILMMGFLVVDHIPDLRLKQEWKGVSVAALVRLLILPSILLVFAKFAPVNDDIRRVALLESGMPSAMFAAALSRYFGADPVTAVRVIIVTSALSIITIPVWLSFGLWFLGFAPK